MSTDHQLMEALNELDRLRERLPKFCPGWCTNSHSQALDEGCDLESASTHLGPDVAYNLPDLRNTFADRLDRPGGGGWSLRLVAGTSAGPSEAPVIALEVRPTGDHDSTVTVFLSTGEARSLAAQLAQQADMDDLHRWG
jgi:hypothetical protein